MKRADVAGSAHVDHALHRAKEESRGASNGDGHLRRRFFRRARRGVARPPCRDLFEALFVVAVIGGIIVDLVPRRPRLECTTHRAQTMSHYPHPYGEPPPVEWTRCEWR
jgi:hypothetical protein